MDRGSETRQKLGTYALVGIGTFVLGVIGAGYLQKPKSFPVSQDQPALSAAPPVESRGQGLDTAPPVPTGPRTNVGQAVSINDGTLADLDTLPGIGPVKAQAIIDYRLKIGGFKSLEELKAVKGIGDKTFQKLLPYIQL